MYFKVNKKENKKVMKIDPRFINLNDLDNVDEDLEETLDEFNRKEKRLKQDKIENKKNKNLN